MTPPSERRPAHPLVSLDYPIRVVGHIVTSASVISLFAGHGGSSRAYLGIASIGLLWPHLAYIVAKRADDSKRAEMNNLLVDSFINGAYLAYCSFAPWLVAVFTSLLWIAFLNIGGIRLAARTMPAMVLGAVFICSFVGFHIDVSAYTPTVLLSIAGMMTYTTVFGITGHQAARRLIASRKAQEHQRQLIEETNRLLETARRAAELAKGEAEAASQAKSMFLANMSHELRTPLNAIIGYGEMLLEDAEDMSPDEVADDLKKITSSGKHLLHLINDVLDLSKIEAGKMDIYVEPMDVTSVVRDVAATAEPLVARNGNKLVVQSRDGIGTLWADVTKVRQILLNLLSNAAKFTKNGTVTLDVDRVWPDGDEAEREWLVIRIIDTGIGMSPANLDKLFQAFSQADASTTRKHGGTGLGLALSRRFCRLMGGDIEVTSTLGEGTTFTVRLPMTVTDIRQTTTFAAVTRHEEETAALPVAKHTAEIGVAGPGAIVVVGTRPGLAALVDRACAARPWLRVVRAPTIDEAVAALDASTPSLLVVDVLAEGEETVSAIARATAQAPFRGVPVLMLALADDAHHGLALDAARFLVKPVSGDALTTAVAPFRGVTGDVLVVEDDAPTRELLCRHLVADGWTVRSADGGTAGMDRLRERLPDVVVLDLVMPGMDGFELLATMRADATWRDLPVIVVTASTRPEADRMSVERFAERLLQHADPPPHALFEQVSAIVGAARGGAARSHEGTHA